MGYIKSHSNYVLSKKHQLTNDGTIYERDITTIGGVNQFSPGQTPIYQSGNFIITVRNDFSHVKDYSNEKWFNNNSNNIWTISNLSGITSNTDDTLKIVLKQNYYDLRDFAYYGSCSELVRSSINDIISRFPGELYAPTIDKKGINVYYTHKIKDEDGNLTEIDSILCGKDCFLVDNPFNINIYTTEIEKNEDDFLKYFCNKGYENYILFHDNDANSITDENEDDYTITSYEVETINNCYSGDSFDNLNECIKSSFDCVMLVAKVTINKNIIIKVLKGDNGNIIYLTNQNGLNYHIRPKKRFYDAFLKTLDSFQKILLNVNTTPKYTATFEIIDENSYGYQTVLKKFTFPTTFGDYNLATTDASYSTYINNLVDISEFYDENFSDNLYRRLTHESIKNFDWSQPKDEISNNIDDYVVGGNKLQNLLRVFGREFDEIKLYIDGISNFNTLSYNDLNNTANYFLTDLLQNDGWDVTNIYPYKLDKIDENNKYIFNQDIISTYNPYSKINGSFINGYFLDSTSNSPDSGCTCSYCYKDANEVLENNTLNNNYALLNNGTVKTKIKQYFNEKEYSSIDINYLFFKILRLNSRGIFSHKGTIESIEMILGLFGLKSKRWYEKKLIKQLNDNTIHVENQRFINPYYKSCIENNGNKDNYFDYEISEFIAFGNIIEDPKYLGDDSENKDNYNDFQINWYNKTKTIIYDTDEYRNGLYVDYQGLPVKSYTITSNNVEKRYLVPFFDKNKIIDGNPFYQMNGGWLWKNKQFNTENQLIESAYTETIQDIPQVTNIKELFAISYRELNNDDIYFVKNVNQNFIIIDGIVYDLFIENNGSNIYYYFNVNVINNSVKVGQQVFIDDIIISSPYGLNNEMTYYLTDELNNTTISIYILEQNDELYCVAKNTFIRDDEGHIKIIAFYNGHIVSSFINNENENNWTNYFYIHNKNFKNNILLPNFINQDPYKVDGWVQLQKESDRIKQIKTLENYFSGNNPHKGKLKYDNGDEYLEYFRHIFKYAVENKEFDIRYYYNQTMNDITKKMWDYGFDIKNNLSTKKIHFFGNYHQSNGDNEDTHYKYSNIITDNEKEYNITTCQFWTDLINNDEWKNQGLGFTEQIINTKKIEIKFYLHKDNTNQMQAIKYIDDVILKYVSQVIPPSTIVNIYYD